MTINLQTSPYYDDFNEEKNFHRILFKPGYAVQSRELTQLQTILQEQIKRFGNHIFKDGSVVLGCAETFQFAVPFVKITREDQFGTVITDAIFQSFERSLIGATVTNEIGVSAKIVLLASDPNGQRVLYLNYLTAATDGSGESVFAESDVLTIIDVNGTSLSRRFVVNSTLATGVGSLFRIDDGLVYAQGCFIRHEAQTKVLEFFSGEPTKNVGFRVLEEGITSDDDVTLLDPAAGSYNYAAPGADRYKLSTQLESYATNVTPESGFYLLFVVDEGKVKRAFNKPQYAELQKMLAQRTFDESGNYTVSGLNVMIREHLKTSNNNGKFSEEDGGDASKIVYGVEPGKAYVEGFDAELKSTEYLVVNKATDVAQFTDKLISTAYGNYVLVTSVTGDWDLTDTCLEVNLQASGNTIAKATVGMLKYDSGSVVSGVYRLYLQNITIQSPYTTLDLDSVTTITDGGSNTCTVSGTFSTQEPTLGTLIFPTTAKAVVDFEDDSTMYFYWKKWSGSINPAITVSLSSNEEWPQSGTLSATDCNRNFMVVNNATNLPVSFTGVGSSIVITGSSATLTLGSGSAASHTVYGLVRVKNQNGIAISLERGWLKVDGTVVTGQSLTNLTAGKIYLGVSNGYDVEAVYAYPSYTGPSENPFPATENFTGWTDITADCQMVNNQNDNFYETSYIRYTGALSLATHKIVVKYRYFLRSSNSGFLNKDSYVGCLIDADPQNPTTPAVGMEYKWLYTYQLPLYKVNATGISYDLRDVIDFRPSKAIRAGYNANSYISSVIMSAAHNLPTAFQSGIYHPDPDRELTTTFTYNLPRIDKVVLTRDGEFKVLTGISSLEPQTPADEAHAMTLGEVHLAPYPSLSTFVAKATGREDYASVVRLVDNRRFTMRDIGGLEQRVNRLEYFTALSMMENTVANAAIYENPADTTSDLLVKKGILVDNFDGLGTGNIYSDEFAAAVDVKNKQLRPSFALQHIPFEHFSGGHTAGQTVLTGTAHGNVSFIQNPVASKSRICGNAILGNYKNGLLRLDPPQDMWMDIHTRPDVQVNYQGNNDGWEFSENPFNLHWNGWQTIWQGVDITTIGTIEVSPTTVTGVRGYNESAQLVGNLTRSMVFSQQLPNNNLRTVGVKVFDISVVPFIRQQVVTFTASGMQPNVIVKAFFDNEDVTEHCRFFTLPTGVTAESLRALPAAELASVYESTASEYGDDLVVDAAGEIIGQFLLPANTFRSGPRVFRLENASGSTMAAAQFTASGLSQINDLSVSSTRFSDVRQDALSTVQNNVVERLTLSNPTTFDATSYGDPMAQTFIVEGAVDGVMLTKVDLFFRKKSNTQDITIQIREVINGFPGNKIVPFSTVTLPSIQVLTSELSDVATSFTFESPVYLKNNVEYALVILPENNNTDYEVWVSELGQNTLLTGERITQQPYVGVLFVPNNNTAWTALEAEDLKFTLWRGEFSVSDTPVIFKSQPIDYLTVTTNSTRKLVPGDVVTVYTDISGTETALAGTISVSGNVVEGTGTNFASAFSIGDRVRAVQTGFTAASDGTTAITGTGFSTRLRKGDVLFDGTTLVGNIVSVDSDTNLTLESASPISGSLVDPKARVTVGIVADNNTTSSATRMLLEEAYPNTLPSNVSYFKDATKGVGIVTYVNGNETEVYVRSGSFEAGDTFNIRSSISGVTNGVDYTITAVSNKNISAIAPNFGTLTVAPTSTVDLRYRLMDSSGDLAAQYSPFKNGETLELREPAVLYSYSNLINGNTHAMEIRATLRTTNSQITPLVDTRKLGMAGLRNVIDNTPGDGPAAAYVTRSVTLDEPADNIRVFADIKLPETTEVRVFAKLQLVGDNTPFEDLEWDYQLEEFVRLPRNRQAFQEYTFFLPPAELGMRFSKFAIKIEMYSPDICRVPLIKNFRTVALI